MTPFISSMPLGVTGSRGDLEVGVRMQHAEIEHRDGMRWLFGAGLVAVAVAVFLWWWDMVLSSSDRERKLGATLRELRTAQSSLSSGKLDPRQGHVARMREPAPPAVLDAAFVRDAHGAQEGDAHTERTEPSQHGQH